MGGRDAKLAAEVKSGAQGVEAKGKEIAGEVKTGAEDIAGQTRQKVGELKEKVSR